MIQLKRIFQNFPGLRPNPVGGAYSAPQTPQLLFLASLETTRWRSSRSLRSRENRNSIFFENGLNAKWLYKPLKV